MNSIFKNIIDIALLTQSSTIISGEETAAILGSREKQITALHKAKLQRQYAELRLIHAQKSKKAKRGDPYGVSATACTDGV